MPCSIVFFLAELHAPVVGRHRVLPQAPGAPQGPEAAEPAHRLCQQEGEAGRLRAGQGLLAARAAVHARGGHAVVPRAGDTARGQDLLHRGRRVESGVHLRGDGEIEGPFTLRDSTVLHQTDESLITL